MNLDWFFYFIFFKDFLLRSLEALPIKLLGSLWSEVMSHCLLLLLRIIRNCTIAYPAGNSQASSYKGLYLFAWVSWVALQFKQLLVSISLQALPKTSSNLIWLPLTTTHLFSFVFWLWLNPSLSNFAQAFQFPYNFLV